MMWRNALVYLTLLTLVAPALEAKARVVFSTEEDGTHNQVFYIDSGDTSNDFIDLEFGASVDAKMRYDVTNDNFELNRDTDFLGNEVQDVRIENLGAAPTCDAAAAGKIYFNTVDRLTYTCDGVSTWNPLENALNATIEFPVVQARRTTSYTLTTAYADIDLDTTDLENDGTSLDHDDTLRDRINIGATAMYQIIYGYTAGGTATATHEARARVRVNDTTVLPGSASVNKNYQGEFSTTSASFLANLTDGDFISLQLQRDATTDATQDEIFFSIVKLEGIKGEKGDPGSSGPTIDDETFTIDNDNTGGDLSLVFGQTLDERLTWNNTQSRFDLTDDLDVAGNIELAGSNLTLDNDDTGGDISVVFGTTLNETLTWDNANTQFSVSDDLEVGGNLQTIGNTITLDSDNTGAGANTSIVAEQGTDNNGEIRYNAANNEWEFSNDGGAFNSFFVPQVFDAYDATGGVALTTTQTVLNIDTTRVTDAAYTLAADEVTFNQDGLYKITGRLTAESVSTAGAQRANIQLNIQSDTGGGYANETGARCQDYMREQATGVSSASCSVTLMQSFTTGNQVRMTHQMTGTTTGRTFANGSGLTIERIR